MNNILTPQEIKLIKFIRNNICHLGQSPSVREIAKFLGYQSPNSAALVINRLIDLGFLKRRTNNSLQIIKELPENDNSNSTIEIPLVGSVSCGLPILAEENIEALIRVSTNLAKPPHQYFLLRANGDSMNLAGIHDGDLVLVRQQNFADDGQKVVALIDNEATIKEIHKNVNAVLLIPHSTNSSHQPIILTDDFKIQGIVVTTIRSSRNNNENNI